MRFWYRSRWKFAVLVLLLIAAEAGAAAQTGSSAQAVPEWMAWRAFQESMSYYSQQSSERFNRMLASQFGLTRAQADALLNAGRTFIADIQRIDADAQVEIRRRYPDALGPGNWPPAGPPNRSSGPRKSIRERAIADGLYAKVESAKQTALNSHLEALGRSLDAGKLIQIRQHVQTTVASRIKIFITDPPATAGSRGLPPGLNRQAPPATR
jgi:hypothetical protein